MKSKKEAIISSLGLIGCGNMGNAIMEGIASKKKIVVKGIRVFDKIKEKAEKLSDKYDAQLQSSNKEVVKNSDIIILAVKPQDSEGLLREIGSMDKSKLIISIMAGVKIEKIAELIGGNIPIARVMPNMAAFVQEAISGISYNSSVKEGHKKIVETLFGSIGEVYEVKESMQDAVTALTGSGPAYFFYIAEALIKVAVDLGFSNEKARKLVAQTMKGSAELLLKVRGTESPEDLRKKVTSKGGTTEAALEVLETEGFKDILIEAIKAAAARSRELSGG